MNGALVSGIRSYTSAVKSMPYSQSMFAQALADTSKFRYSEFGEYTAVREITGETAGDYDSCDGFNAACIDLDVWNEFRAEWDREISFSVDYIDEMNSILRGMTLTGTEKLKASWRRLGPEIDAVSCASIWHQMPAGGKHANSEDGYKTDIDNIVQTLIAKDNELYDMGWYGDVAVMISSAVATTLSQAIVKHNGLASGAMLQPVESTRVTRKVSFRGEDYFEDGLSFKYDVLRFNSRMFIYKVPKQCMISDVILLDKKTAGQTAGGWIPDTSAEDFCNVEVLVVPVDAAALSVRHIVSNLTVPLQAYNVEKFDINEELSGLNKMYDGQVYIENIGVDQNADRFKYMNRIKYGVAVFGVMAHTILGIYSTPSGDPTLTSVNGSTDELTAAGGSVIVTASGSDLGGVIAQAFNALSTKVGEAIRLAGSNSIQVGVVNLPANAGETDATYTIKFSLDEGTTYEDETLTVTVKAAGE